MVNKSTKVPPETYHDIKSLYCKYYSILTEHCYQHQLYNREGPTEDALPEAADEAPASSFTLPCQVYSHIINHKTAGCLEAAAHHLLSREDHRLKFPPH